MVEIRGRLDPEVGALLMKALSIAEDALFRENAEADSGKDRPTAAQRSADGLGRIAEVALEGDLSGQSRGSAKDRFQVVMHVKPTAGGFPAGETVAGEPEMELGSGNIEHGPGGRVARAVARPSPHRSEQGDFHHSAPPSNRLREPGPRSRHRSGAEEAGTVFLDSARPRIRRG